MDASVASSIVSAIGFLKVLINLRDLCQLVFLNQWKYTVSSYPRPRTSASQKIAFRSAILFFTFLMISIMSKMILIPLSANHVLSIVPIEFLCSMLLLFFLGFVSHSLPLLAIGYLAIAIVGKENAR